MFSGQAGAVLPAPGDEFALRTVKALTSSDVYEFAGTVSSVQTLAPPRSFSLDQNYPNPFNPVTTIGFGLASAANVNLTVYDILGRRVTVLVNENLGAGHHQVTFDGARLASGVYFYRIQVRPVGAAGGGTGRFVETKKLCLVQ